MFVVLYNLFLIVELHVINFMFAVYISRFKILKNILRSKNSTDVVDDNLNTY